MGVGLSGTRAFYTPPGGVCCPHRGLTCPLPRGVASEASLGDSASRGASTAAWWCRPREAVAGPRCPPAGPDGPRDAPRDARGRGSLGDGWGGPSVAAHRRAGSPGSRRRKVRPGPVAPGREGAGHAPRFSRAHGVARVPCVSLRERRGLVSVTDPSLSLGRPARTPAGAAASPRHTRRSGGLGRRQCCWPGWRETHRLSCSSRASALGFFHFLFFPCFPSLCSPP